MNEGSPKQLDDLFIDQVYDIALDPTSIEDLINQWGEVGLSDEVSQLIASRAELFGPALDRHVERAQNFLEIAEDARPSPLAEALTDFDNAAAFVVNTRCEVVDANAIAGQQMNLRTGTCLDEVLNDPEKFDDFRTTINDMAAGTNTASKLVQVHLSSYSNTVLFHLRLLHHTDPQDGALVLVVSTQFFWQEDLGRTLEENFGLSQAEQGIIRRLLEGKTVKDIAQDRSTSEGTVRVQLKSIFAKMDARSQSEVMRTALLLRDVVKRPVANILNVVNPMRQQDWLEREVYKPFQTVALPDGRNLQYHSQGPIDGFPILYSHGMSGLIRWPRDVLKSVYRNNLRVITPIRAGYGQSDCIDWSNSVTDENRNDTLFLLDHLSIDRCPYVTTGLDFLWAIDLGVNGGDRVSEIISICARPPLSRKEPREHPTKSQERTNKWYAFFQFTAKHAPKLFYYSVCANLAMCRRVGIKATVRKWHATSEGDLRILDDPNWTEPWNVAIDQVFLSAKDSARSLTMELGATFTNWWDLMQAARDVPIKIYNGGEDPTISPKALKIAHEQYPWIDFHTFDNSGSGVFCDHHDVLLPEFARAARDAARD